MIRVVDDRVKAALGQDGPDWRVLNACPACSYEVRVTSLPFFSRQTTDD